VWSRETTARTVTHGNRSPATDGKRRKSGESPAGTVYRTAPTVSVLDPLTLRR
jgi:hypothetical protein